MAFFCFFRAFIHLTLKLDRVKHGSYTYIKDAFLAKSQELNARHPAYMQSNNPTLKFASLSRHAYSAAIASKRVVKAYCMVCAKCLNNASSPL